MSHEVRSIATTDLRSICILAGSLLMAHNIGHMLYAGATPWHGLGERLLQPATLDEALASGQLNWEVSLVQLFTAETPSSFVPHRVAVVRDDPPSGNAARVLGVVHPDFRPLQNRDGAVLFDGARSRRGGGWKVT